MKTKKAKVASEALAEAKKPVEPKCKYSAIARKKAQALLALTAQELRPLDAELYQLYDGEIAAAAARSIWMTIDDENMLLVFMWHPVGVRSVLVTINDVRAVLIDVIEQLGNDECDAILESFGVRRVPHLDLGDYAAVIVAAERRLAAESDRIKHELLG